MLPRQLTQVAGIAADRIGRQPVLCLWLVLLFFAGTMLVFALTVPVFAALRFLLSAGAAGVVVASHVLLFEVTGARYRASYCAVAIASGIFGRRRLQRVHLPLHPELALGTGSSAHYLSHG
ncbi:hypothetical protein MRX96_052486 [Rhipicephalus microplus]